MSAVVVRAPASSANLGPGFDALAAALALSLELEVAHTGSFAVDTDLPGIPRDRDNLCVRAFERLAPADGLAFRISSAIPLTGGLGSSAAAIVAGLMAADSLFELGADLLAVATELEGHPDNVAAALLGGFVVCAAGNAVRIDVPVGLEAVLVVPREPVRTAAARRALPERVPLSDAVFNVGHAALLTLALARGDAELLEHALRDRLHQDRRAHLFPRSAALLARARELGALGATISGAGPSVLFWARVQETGALRERLEPLVAGWADVARVTFQQTGASVTRTAR